MLHSLSITFQFHCLKNIALIHCHIQFTALMFGRTFLLLKCTRTYSCSLLSFESNLVMIATSSVISQKLDGSSLSRPKAFPVTQTVLLLSSSQLIWWLGFSFSIHPSCQFIHCDTVPSFKLYFVSCKVKKKKSNDLILGIKNIEHSLVYKMTETEEYTAKVIQLKRTYNFGIIILPSIPDLLRIDIDQKNFHSLIIASVTSSY